MNKKILIEVKMKLLKSLLIVLILYYLVFHTPRFISDFVIGKASKLEGTYRDTKTGKVYRYSSNHGEADGTLWPTLIKNGKAKREEINIKVYPFMSIEKLPKHPVYSSFTMVCAHMCYYYLPKRPLRIGIHVNKRTKETENAKGNFLILTSFSIDPSMNLEDIQKAQHKAVISAKNSPKNYMTLSDLLMYISYFDFMFNSHRMMSKIKLNDGTILEEVREKPFKYQLENLAYINTTLPLQVVFGHDGSNYNIKDMQVGVFGR